jgi:Cu/Ag efflux protein CusF
MHPHTLPFLLASALALPFAVHAQSAGHAHHGAAAPSPASAPAQANPWAEGEVRRVDRAGSKLTLRHGDIEVLGMPPMTMVFQVRDPALLDRAAVGDKVRFMAAYEGGVYLVKDLQPLKP